MELPSLIGRQGECDTLDRLIVAVGAGESGALVVRGDPGMGKTALLEYLAGQAADTGCNVVRVLGVQAEMDMAFSGLHQLSGPMLDRDESLPPPQRDALLTAFGISEGPPPDRFLAGLAVLNLLSQSAGKRPLICLVEDEQWLDRASAQALSFAARRLAAAPVCLVFATRELDKELAGLPELTVGRLRDADARALLVSALACPLDARIADVIVAEAHGNPRVLLDLPRELSAAALAGGFGLSGTVPLTGQIDESLARRLGNLPDQARLLLRLAAADPTGDLSLLWRAARRLGVPAQAAAPAIEAGLAEFAGLVRFWHPLARSAVYQLATLPERRQVHAALAEATDPAADPDWRAWHQAQATTGPDENVASELERSAGRARARAGLAAAAAFLERAVVLTADPARQADRVLAAARASMQAGAFGKALELLTQAEARPLDELTSARAELLRGQVASASGSGGDALPLLLKAAKRLEAADAGLAREIYPNACLLWDNDVWRALLAGQVRLARTNGALAQLPIMLDALGTAVAASGEFAAAAALIAEADSIRQVTGAHSASLAAMLLAALRGRDAEAATLIRATIAAAQAGQHEFAVAYAHWAASIFHIGAGRYERALTAARLASQDTTALPVSMWVLPELVEAAARAGQAGLAREVFNHLAEFTQSFGTDSALGIRARCQALLSHDAAEDLYHEAVDRLGRTRLRPELARAHLLYGEWLRRQGRRLDARAELGAAADMLTEIGMTAFAERARRELTATGETIRRRGAETVAALTAQEALIAQLARDGRTNPQIGAQLYLSARTVEWHLRKVFTKLDISSRRDLLAVLAQAAA